MKKYMKSVLLTAVMALGMLSFAAYAQDNGDMVNIKGRVFNSATGDPVDGAGHLCFARTGNAAVRSRGRG